MKPFEEEDLHILSTTNPPPVVLCLYEQHEKCKIICKVTRITLVCDIPARSFIKGTVGHQGNALVNGFFLAHLQSVMWIRIDCNRIRIHNI